MTATIQNIQDDVKTLEDLLIGKANTARNLRGPTATSSISVFIPDLYKAEHLIIKIKRELGYYAQNGSQIQFSAKDSLGNEIKPGDTVAWKGANKMKSGKIVEITQKSGASGRVKTRISIKPTNGYSRISLSNMNNVVLIQKA